MKEDIYRIALWVVSILARNTGETNILKNSIFNSIKSFKEYVKCR